MLDERLAAARGAVRDGAAAIESFVQLLGSRRVGPRGILRALPEVQEGCATLRGALDALAEALAVTMAADSESVAAARAVITPAEAEVARLESELGRGLEESRPGSRGRATPPEESRPGGRGRATPPERTIDARQRLAMEAHVRRTSRELSSALLFLDLLVASIELRPTSLNLGDLLRERGSGLLQAQPAIRLLVALGEDCDSVEADPRVIGPLLELVVAALAESGVTCLLLEAGRRADGRAVVRLRAARGGDEGGTRVALMVPLRESSERARAVALVTARRAGMELRLPEAGASSSTLIL
ncbi:hypothetical protein [Chondromyces crocatus]|uniref:Uncharacterized protein n=1 Tax=Chondromyces crocatus TaxID=52 RepID=A0A0K1EKN2_CHOCO|nr:hypothetical protein [Chondromyces crocatus]AKT41434.1 uncharacterized protein CMC5_056340 [Chondromyces crocatus]